MAIFVDRHAKAAEKQQRTITSRISILKFTCIVNIIQSNELRDPRHPRLCSDRFFVRRRMRRDPRMFLPCCTSKIPSAA